MPAHLHPDHAHTAHFHLGGYPAALVGDFIAAGLRAGDHCALILTALHRRAVEKRLHALGVQPQQCRSLRTIDTHAALAGLLDDGRLDMLRASALLNSVLQAPAGSHSRCVRVVGDLAPTLLEAGHTDAAVAFEHTLDRLARHHGAEVFCVYPLAHFCRQGQPQALIGVCAEHASLDFPEALWAQGFLAPAVAA